MSNPTKCPNNTPWCTEHQPEDEQCVSPAIKASTSCYVWLLRELEGVEPVIIVDGPPTAAQLSLFEAVELCDAIHELRQAALKNRPVWT